METPYHRREKGWAPDFWGTTDGGARTTVRGSHPHPLDRFRTGQALSRRGGDHPHPNPLPEGEGVRRRERAYSRERRGREKGSAAGVLAPAALRFEIRLGCVGVRPHLNPLPSRERRGTCPRRPGLGRPPRSVFVRVVYWQAARPAASKSLFSTIARSPGRQVPSAKLLPFRYRCVRVSAALAKPAEMPVRSLS